MNRPEALETPQTPDAASPSLRAVAPPVDVAACSYLRGVLPHATLLLAHRAQAAARAGGRRAGEPMEPWRSVAERLSAALCTEADRLDEESAPGVPAPSEVLLGLAAEEVSRRRVQGEPLASAVGVLASYRQAFLELATSRRLDPPTKAECMQRIDRFFTRFEAALCDAWARAGAELTTDSPPPTRRDLVERAHRYATLFEHLAEPGLIVGDGRAITEWNLAAAVQLGGPGEAASSSARGPRRPAWLAHIEHTLLALEDGARCTVCLPTPGGPRTYDVTVGRVGTGPERQRFVMLSDRSKHLLSEKLAAEKQQLEQQLDRKTDIARRLRAFHADLVETERMEALASFSERLARDLDAPLGWLEETLGQLERLAGLPTSSPTAPVPATAEELGELVEDAQEAARTLLGITQRLATFATPAPAHQAQGQVDVRRLLDDAVLLSASALVLRAELKLELEPLPAVKGHAGQLGQALMSLLVHAARSVDARGTVTVKAQGVEGGACVEVRHTGAGFGPEALARLFEPFVAERLAGACAGLELAVAWRVVEAHGGHLTAESTPGQSTVLRLWLPAVEGAPGRAG